MREYELALIVSPNVDEEKFPIVMEKVSQFITTRGGVVTETVERGKRKLAYPIKHFTEGNYVVIQLKLEPEMTKDLESDLRLSEEIIRHLLVRLDDK